MRRHLLSETVELLRRRPGVRPTTAQLADAAHVSIGTVYRYFADMDAVIDELRATAIGDITTSLAVGVGSAMDAEPMAAMVTIVETLTAAFEKHDPVLRVSYSTAEAEFGAAWSEVEEPLVPLARILPARLRPDLDQQALGDLVFLTMGATANLCLRIALLRPPDADRDALIATAARMLLAALVPG
jgi:TetR/AcrR family transcriptional regulator, ethionamide resistance regulator